MSASAIEQLQALVALRTPSLDIQPFVDSLSQDIAAGSAEKVSEAVATLTSMGLDPRMFLPVSRSYSRIQREDARAKQDALNAEQARRHADELHTASMREHNAAAALAELAVANAKARSTV